MSRTYYGLDNTNSSSRFIFLGSARVNPSVTMGFEIMIEIEAGGTSSKVSQVRRGWPYFVDATALELRVVPYGQCRRLLW